ncbi:hypothetical protein GGTG_09064 [Gaeumannomyces tritici R3-111a-1]|uniref:Uncharacterized protein n=1 Tax=Gaeumannomyces tritici (strain R3-111a-1) TaxID=644352 RepID=J3P6C3_GAET3|nr:hypothetical protein GGTG_09064 [Gaeumannomyces tritici R3-111a-1]EJT72197.1 hypothetical protein GGTG_09064 [Gaeumannomyces tritici R3-111a-1]
MQLVSFAAFLLAAALPVIAKMMLGGGLGSQLPLLSSSVRRRLSQRRTMAERGVCASPLVCPKTPVMQATPAMSQSPAFRPQSPAVRFREPFGTSSPGDDDDVDYARPDTPFHTPFLRPETPSLTPFLRPQSPKSQPQTSSNSNINPITRGRRVSYWDNPYADRNPSHTVAAADSGRQLVPTITILEVRDGVVVKREVEKSLDQDTSDHQRYPRSPYPAKYPQSPFLPQYPKSPYPSKYPQSPYPGGTTDQTAFPPVRESMPTDSSNSLAVTGRGADLIERAATWAAERGVDTNVGLEDFEERSYVGRAIRKLRGTSRRERQESARAQVVREARKNWAARSLDATHHWAARGLGGTHHLAHRGLEGVEAVGRGAADGLDAVRRGAAGGLEAVGLDSVGGALRPRGDSRSGGREGGEPFPHAEDAGSPSSSSSSSSRQSSPSPRRRVLHKTARVRDADDADLSCIVAEVMAVSAVEPEQQSAGRRFSLSMKSLKDLGRRTRSGTDSSTGSSASDPGSRTRSASDSSGEERTGISSRRVSLPWNKAK